MLWLQPQPSSPFCESAAWAGLSWPVSLACLQSEAGDQRAAGLRRCRRGHAVLRPGLTRPQAGWGLPARGSQGLAGQSTGKHGPPRPGPGHAHRCSGLLVGCLLSQSSPAAVSRLTSSDPRGRQNSLLGGKKNKVTLQRGMRQHSRPLPQVTNHRTHSTEP